MTPTSSFAKKTELLLKQTRRHFPRFDDDQVEITPIEKGGSDRRFYRVRSSPEHTLILVKYDLERSENRQYVKVAEFLAAHEIRAPKIFFHDEEEGLIWIEDLGESDLWSYRSESWLVRRGLYESALEEIAKLHCLPTSAAEGIRSELPTEFDAALYRWEQHYFFENCLGRYFAVEEKLRDELAALPVLESIAQRLESLPRVLVHRDFQSQNIIVRDEQAHLIDFQGMRPGLSKYDLASLLYDPYVQLAAQERDELFEVYRELRERHGSPLRVDDEEIFRLCAMQRLMQALGRVRLPRTGSREPEFSRHIPAALESLRSILLQLEGAERLHAALSALR